MKLKLNIERIPALFASHYEKAARKVIEKYYGQVADDIVSSLQEGRILDLGTGPGYLPIEIAKRIPSIRVVGIDLGKRLIEIAKGNARKADLDQNLQFEVGNAANLRFGDDSFDMIISTGMFHALKDPVKVLRECYRVLKSGGEAWIFDPARVLSQIDVNKWKASFTPWERFLYLFFPLFTRINPSRKYSRDQVLEMIAATHFEVHKVEKKKDEIRIRLRK